MSSTLLAIQSLRKVWREQDFKLSSDQQKRLDELTDLRRREVSEFYEQGRVWSGPSEASKPVEE
tara:strand:- start:3842 stop:4033 length:192 start_codon:yes stop_codon:yes gene_type:complete